MRYAHGKRLLLLLSGNKVISMVTNKNDKDAAQEWANFSSGEIEADKVHVQEVRSLTDHERETFDRVMKEDMHVILDKILSETVPLYEKSRNPAPAENSNK